MNGISLEGLVVARIADTHTTRSDFARKTGVKSWRTLKNKLRGSSQLSFAEAVALGEQLGITLDELRDLAK